MLSWALYDLANTFFAVAMVTFYFPMWLMEAHNAKELTFSITLSLSMAAVAVLMPICGVIADVTQVRMRYLRWATCACTLLTASIAFAPGLISALVLFALANTCYQVGTVFYDALLPQLVSRQSRGQVSGMGAAFGYLGSMAGLLCLWPFVKQGGPQAAFLPSAAFFMLFALPSFVLIKDEEPKTTVSLGEAARLAMVRVAATFRTIRNHAAIWRYLWASFFSACAINTILVFMALYTRKVLGFTQADVVKFFLFSQVFAFAGAFIISRGIPILGAKRVLMLIWMGWIAALGLVAVNLSAKWLWVAGPAIGFCLGATWSTSRVLIMELAKTEEVGEMLGLCGLVSRVASIIGPLVWGAIVWKPGNYQLAVMVQMLLLGIGVFLLSGLRVSSQDP